MDSTSPNALSRSLRAPLWLAGAAAVLIGCAQPQVVSPEGSTDAVKKAVDASAPAFSDVPEPAVDAPQGVQATALDSTVSRVTVYSDRARVTRTTTAKLSEEPTVFAFNRLPGWVDDESVRVATSAGRLIDVQVQRNFLVKPTDPTYTAAAEAHKKLTRQMAALNDEVAILDAQKAQIESIKAFSLEKISTDTVMGSVNVATYGQVVTFISDSLRQTAEARRKVEEQRADLQPELVASKRALDELQSLTRLEETTVLVTLQSSQPTETTLELAYMLPGATWEPMHEVRTTAADPGTVQMTAFAVVTQTSGEDWGNAEIAFSTQSSTESVRIPALEKLALGDTQSATRIITRQQSSFSRARQAYEGQNELWNKMNSKSQHNFEQVYRENFEALQIIQSKTVQLFQSLQERGTTVHFKADRVASVRGDGHPVRLRIGRCTLKTDQKLVAAPEQTLNVVRTLELSNSSDQPFLPGKVALYQDGAFMGMTDLSFIAEGEQFALFFNVEDQIKLSRTLDRKQSALVRNKRTRMQITFIVTVENLSPRQTALTLADRIPVSENKDITVSGVRIAPATKPDNQGLLNWEVTLAPNERRQFTISYQIEYPPTLVVETRRKRMSPSAAPRNRYDLEEQILDLESNF